MGDEFVMTNLMNYGGKPLVSAEQVKLSSRLVDSPAIVVGHESASMRRMMTMVESGTTPKLPDQRLEINAKPPIIKHLATLRESDADFAAVVARQLFSNALKG